MHHAFLILILCATGLTIQSKPASYGAFMGQADAFLSKFVEDGMVDYEALAADPSELDELMNMMARISLPEAMREQKACYINAYNIAVIKGVLKHYPVASVKDIPGFFDVEEYQIAGQTLTLDGLEKGLLYQRFPDPRLHFVLVCAARGCPPLTSEAYRAELLEAQLNDRTQAALESPAFVQVDHANRTIRLSELFQWYKGHFTADAPDLVSYINRYRSRSLPEDYRITYFTYNWELNAKKK